MIFTDLGAKALSFANKNASTLMTVGVVAGIVGTAYLSHEAGKKSQRILEELEYTSEKPPTRKEKFQKVWKVYLPPFASAVATITLAVGAHSVNMRRQATLIEAYLMANSARKELVEKTEEVVGKNKMQKIHEEIVKDKVTANPPTEENVIFTSHGDVLCFDVWSGRYFKSDPEYIRKTINDANERMVSNERIYYNDLYYEWGIPPIKVGSNLRWSMEETGLIDLRAESGLHDITGRPYYAIDWYTPPVPKY